MMPMVRNPVDWDNIDLVVFDMDGTLYDQRRLRARMLMALAGEAVRSRTLRVPAILQTFRRCRETLGNQPSANFMSRQYELTAERCGWPIEMVREAVLDWIEQRPLEYLNACIYAGVRSEEHTSELQSLMRISYAVFCLNKKKNKKTKIYKQTQQKQQNN